MVTRDINFFSCIFTLVGFQNGQWKNWLEHIVVAMTFYIYILISGGYRFFFFNLD